MSYDRTSKQQTDKQPENNSFLNIYNHFQKNSETF